MEKTRCNHEIVHAFCPNNTLSEPERRVSICPLPIALADEMAFHPSMAWAFHAFTSNELKLQRCATPAQEPAAGLTPLQPHPCFWGQYTYKQWGDRLHSGKRVESGWPAHLGPSCVNRVISIRRARRVKSSDTHDHARLRLSTILIDRSIAVKASEAVAKQGITSRVLFRNFRASFPQNKKVL